MSTVIFEPLICNNINIFSIVDFSSQSLANLEAIDSSYALSWPVFDSLHQILVIE